ncbi:MAG: ECF transporter S component [Clostridia bacterium]|nr:ECF transporter S component [Clostridia bacterium]
MENKHTGAPAQARSTADKLVKLALLAAISVILALLIHFPILPQLSFLEYDMADVPILIGTFLYGPFWGLLLTLVVSVIQGVTVSASSGIIGIVMHFIATGGFVLVAGLIYRGKRRTLKYAIIALIAGALTMVALMVPLNYFISPMFIQSPEFPYKAAQSTIWSMMWLFVAFNAIKAFGNALITFLLYKAVGRVLKLQFVHPSSEKKKA